MCLEVGLTGLGTGLHEGQEESPFLFGAAGDEGLSVPTDHRGLLVRVPFRTP